MAQMHGNFDGLTFFDGLGTRFLVRLLQLGVAPAPKCLQLGVID